MSTKTRAAELASKLDPTAREQSGLDPQQLHKKIEAEIKKSTTQTTSVSPSPPPPPPPSPPQPPPSRNSSPSPSTPPLPESAKTRAAELASKLDPTALEQSGLDPQQLHKKIEAEIKKSTTQTTSVSPSPPPPPQPSGQPTGGSQSILGFVLKNVLSNISNFSSAYLLGQSVLTAIWTAFWSANWRQSVDTRLRPEERLVKHLQLFIRRLARPVILTAIWTAFWSASWHKTSRLPAEGHRDIVIWSASGVMSALYLLTTCWITGIP